MAFGALPAPGTPVAGGAMPVKPAAAARLQLACPAACKAAALFDARQGTVTRLPHTPCHLACRTP